MTTRVSKGARKRAAKPHATYVRACTKETNRAIQRIRDGRWPGSVGPIVKAFVR